MMLLMIYLRNTFRTHFTLVLLYLNWRKCLEDVYIIKSLSHFPLVGWWMNKNPNANYLWNEYAIESHRTWWVDTPSIEVALYLMRKDVDVVTAAVEYLDNMLEENADGGLRELIQVLISDNDDSDDSYISLEKLSETA